MCANQFQIAMFHSMTLYWGVSSLRRHSDVCHNQRKETVRPRRRLTMGLVSGIGKAFMADRLYHCQLHGLKTQSYSFPIDTYPH